MNDLMIIVFLYQCLKVFKLSIKNAKKKLKFYDGSA
jgi:hypothetical protein